VNAGLELGVAKMLAEKSRFVLFLVWVSVLKN
jgi:hypothetical protein